MMQNVHSALTDVFVSDVADDNAFPVPEVGAVEWNLMNDNPYGIIWQRHIQLYAAFYKPRFLRKVQTGWFYWAFGDKCRPVEHYKKSPTENN